MGANEKYFHPAIVCKSLRYAPCDHAGALICPNCGLIIITPAHHDVRPGVGRCPRCDHSFTVGAAVARKANSRARRPAASTIEDFFRRAVAGHHPWNPR